MPVKRKMMVRMALVQGIMVTAQQKMMASKVLEKRKRKIMVREAMAKQEITATEKQKIKAKAPTKQDPMVAMVVQMVVVVVEMTVAVAREVLRKVPAEQVPMV